MEAILHNLGLTHPQCSQQENGKSFPELPPCSQHQVPQLCPALFGQEMLPWKCLKGTSNVTENQKSPKCAAWGVFAERETPGWAGK